MIFRKYDFIFLLHLVYVSADVNVNSSVRVVIIGAGAAGIAAGSRLLEKGITNITILEAEKRVGGRIYSVQFGAGAVDLGAEWVKKFQGNVVYNIVQKYKLLVKNNFAQMTLHYSNTKENISRALNDKIVSVIDKIYHSSRLAPEGVTIGDYYKKQFNESISTLFQPNEVKQFVLNDFEDYLQHLTLCIEGSKTWNEPSAKSDYNAVGLEYSNFNGHGFKTVLDILLYTKTSKQFPHDILLNKIVNKIVWDNNTENNNIVTVKCSDGTVYKADYVIFTPSLGVMKEQHTALFEPRLPQEKVNAIEKLGTGPVMKAFLQFNGTWWPKVNFSGFNFIWSKEDKEILRKEEKHWLLGLVALLSVPGVPNVLSAWLTGVDIAITEGLDNNKMTQGFTYALKKFLEPKYQVLAPTSVLASRWLSNPHFRGISVFETVASRNDKSHGVDHIRILGKPLYNSDCKVSVLFAGDATHPTQFGTVDGAISRGFSEADKILLLKELRYD